MPQRRVPWSARPAVRVGLVLSVVVLGVVLVFWAGQRSFIYYPDRTSPGAAAEAIRGARDVTLHTADDLELDAWLVPAHEATDRRQAVLYLPGNGGHRGGRVGIAQLLSARGFTVLLVEYRGYGGNPGRPTEEGLALDARAAQELLEAEGFAAADQIYLGESLGTAVAARLADERPPGGVVLRSPFPEMAALARTHFPLVPVGLLRDHYPAIEHVRRLEVPVTVVLGAADSLVPPGLSKRVADAAPVLLEQVVVDGAEHNDPVMWGRPVVDAAVRLADSVRAPDRS